MSTTIDEKVVEMRFDNKRFESNVKTSLTTLDRLKQSLKLDDATRGFDNIDKAAQNVSLEGIASGVDALQKRFSTFGIIGMRVVENVTDSMMKLANKTISFLSNGVVQGGINRAMNLENAHFQLQGLLKDEEAVQAVMKNVGDSVDGTAYSLDSAAKVASQFAASGMRAGDQMYSSLRAVAGVAAMTNSEYDSIGQIFTTVAGNGRLMGDQLLQLSSKGMNAAATLADYLTKVGNGAKVTEADVRKMVTDGKISFDIFAAAMDDAFGEHAKKANETFTGAMSNVKASLARIGAEFISPLIVQKGPLVQFFNTLRERINDVKANIGPLADIFVHTVTIIADAATKYLGKLDLTGHFKAFYNIIDILKNILKGLWSVLKPIKQAFSDIFPPKTIEQVVDITKALKTFSSHLKLSDKTSNDLKNTFRGLFAILDIAKQILSSVVKATAPLLGSFNALGRGVLSVTGYIGNWLAHLDSVIKKNDIFSKVLDNVSGLIIAVSNSIKNFFLFVKDKFSFPGFEIFHEFLKKVCDRMSQVGKAAGEMNLGVSTALDSMGKALEHCKFFELLQALWTFTKKVGSGIAKVFGNLANGIIDSLSNANFSGIIDLLNGVSLGAIALGIKKFLDTVKKPIDDIGNIKKSVVGILNSVKGCFEAYQTQLKAGTLLKIAAAIAILAASILTISLIDSDKLSASLGAITVLFANLMTSMSIFSKISGHTNGVIKSCTAMISMSIAIDILASALKKISALNMDQLAVGLTGLAGLTVIMVAVTKAMGKSSKTIIKGATQMVIFAVAIKILASACKDFSELKWEALAKGLTGVGALLTEISLFLNITKFSGKVTTTAAGIVILASAIKILASACKDFGVLSWEEIGKGLTSVGVLLTEIAIFTNVTGHAKHVMSTGASLVVISASMKIFASAVSDFGAMKWEEIGKGLAAMGGALTAVAVSVKLMPKNMGGIGAGLVVIGAALEIISNVMGKLGGFSWNQISKGLVVMGGALAELAIGLRFMKGTLTGSAAMIIAAGALALMTPVLTVLGAMSWKSIAKGLVTIAGAFTVIGVAGAVLTPIVPTILGLGGAFALIGVGVLAIGVGLLAAGAGLSAVAVGFTALAAAGAAGATAIVAALTVIITGIAGLIPAVAKKMGEAVIEFCKVISDGAPAIGKAVKALVLTFIDVFGKCVPAIADGALKLIAAVLKALVKYTPKIVDYLFQFLIKLLEGIAKKLPALIKAAINVLMAFFSGVVDALKGIDVNVLIKGIAGIGLLSGIMLALGAVSSLVPGAMIGVLGMGVVIAELALVLAAVGALAQIPGLSWLIGEGGKLLEGIGTAIGKFVGGIVGGFMSGVSSQFPQIGSDLSGFMMNMQPFIEGASKIDASMLAGVNALAKTILILTAANVLDGLTSWFTGGSPLANFGEQLVPFGVAMKDFSLAIAGMDGNLVANAATAGKTLAEMASTLPNTGGVVGFFTGENDMKTFGKQLVPFGEAMNGFAEVVKGLDTNIVINAATAGKAMVEMASTIPNSGGVVGFFAGENDMNAFGEQLVPFGEAMKNFSNAVKGIDAAAITNSATAGKALVELANTVPNSGGVVGFFAGENDMDLFGEQLVPFGEAMKAYSNAVKGIDAAAITNSATAGGAIVELSNTLPNIGGLVSWFTGDKDMAAFGGSLVSFGENFAKYYGYMKNVDSGIITATANAATSIVELQSSLPKEGGWFSKDMSLSSFGSDMASFGSYFNTYYNYISGIDTSQLASVITQTYNLVNLARSMSDVDTSGMSSFSSALTTLGQQGVNGFILAFSNAIPTVQSTLSTFVNSGLTAITYKYSEFITVGTTTMTNFIKGVGSKDGSAKTKYTSIVSKALNAIRNKYSEFITVGSTTIANFINGIGAEASSVSAKCGRISGRAVNALQEAYSDFYSAGSYLVIGFANGISDNTFMAIARSRAMAAASAQAAAKELDERSPSKVGYRIGDYFGVAFVNALGDNISKAYTAGSEIAKSAKNGLSNAISKIVDLVDTGIDYQPTIKPVIDLSDVQNGAHQLYRLMSNANGYSLSGSLSLAQSTASSIKGSQAASNVDTNTINKLQQMVKSLSHRPSGAIDNKFYITGNDPKEIANEVSRILQKQVDRRGAAWE